MASASLEVVQHMVIRWYVSVKSAFFVRIGQLIHWDLRRNYCRLLRQESKESCRKALLPTESEIFI